MFGALVARATPWIETTASVMSSPIVTLAVSAFATFVTIGAIGLRMKYSRLGRFEKAMADTELLRRWTIREQLDLPKEARSEYIHLLEKVTRQLSSTVPQFQSNKGLTQIKRLLDRFESKYDDHFKHYEAVQEGYQSFRMAVLELAGLIDLNGRPPTGAVRITVKKPDPSASLNDESEQVGSGGKTLEMALLYLKVKVAWRRLLKLAFMDLTDDQELQFLSLQINPGLVADHTQQPFNNGL